MSLRNSILEASQEPPQQGGFGYMFKIEAATGGLLMNMAFLLTGTTSTNPVLAILGVLLILAWKNADYIGLDRYLLPLLGTPWKQAAPVTAKVKVSTVPVAAAR